MNKFATLAMLLIPVFSYAQSRLDIEEHILQILAQGDETSNSSYYDLLVYFYENPIELNSATKEDLMQLSLLTEEQASAIINHRTESGQYLSIYELQTIDQLPIEQIKLIRPFITVIIKTSLIDSFRGIARGSTNYLTTSYSRIAQQAAGFIEGKYLGSPSKFQTRLRLRNPGKLSIGLTLQKDPGEPWLHDTGVKHPDHYTGHLFVENHGVIKQLVLGDYRLQYGQGLILGAGFMAGKNIETVTSVKQTSIGVLPYSSVAESNYLRGMAINFNIKKKFNLSVFYSNQHLDATVANDSLGIVSSIRTGGLHRTASEINGMNQLHEQVMGGVIQFRSKRLSLGTIFLANYFDKTILPSSTVANYYRFNGNHLANFSWFGEYRLNNFTLFSEVAKTINGGWAANTGILGQVSRYAGLSLSIRYLEKDFHSFYGQSFSERATLGNENGVFWGLKLYPSRSITISGYYDIYRFPWLISSSASPVHGKDVMMRFEYKFDKNNRSFIQIRNEIVESSEQRIPADKITENRILKTILNIDYQASSSLSFRSRVQYNLFNKIESGMLMLQDINYNSMNFGISGRVLFFDTESFNTRQYVYEKDVLFSYNTRAFFGRGMSYYLLLKYKPIRPLSLRVKLAFTEYLGQSAIGTGNNMIQGNTRTQVTAQLHYRF